MRGMEARSKGATSERRLTYPGTAQPRGAPDTCTWRMSAFPRPAGCRRGATAGPWHHPQWTTPANSNTLVSVQATRTRQHEQARSVLRQARAASAEEAVSALPPEVHTARGLHEPDMSPVPENRENLLTRPGCGRPPISTAPHAERAREGALSRVRCGTCARRIDGTIPLGTAGPAEFPVDGDIGTPRNHKPCRATATGAIGEKRPAMRMRLRRHRPQLGHRFRTSGERPLRPHADRLL